MSEWQLSAYTVLRVNTSTAKTPAGIAGAEGAREVSRLIAGTFRASRRPGRIESGRATTTAGLGARGLLCTGSRRDTEEDDNDPVEDLVPSCGHLYFRIVPVNPSGEFQKSI